MASIGLDSALHYRVDHQGTLAGWQDGLCHEIPDQDPTLIYDGDQSAILIGDADGVIVRGLTITGHDGLAREKTLVRSFGWV